MDKKKVTFSKCAKHPYQPIKPKLQLEEPDAKETSPSPNGRQTMTNPENYSGLEIEDLEALIDVYSKAGNPDLANRIETLQQVLDLKAQAQRWKTFSRLHEQRARNNWEDAQALEKLNRELDQLNNNRSKLIRHLRGYMIPAEQMAITELSQFINPRGSINLGELYEWLENIAVPVK